MRSAHRVLLLLVGIGLFALTGCVTSKRVQAIVAESNAAMVSPYIQGIDDDAPGGWEQAVERIDQLIAAYPGNTVLVSHLRLRQAMLLTVQEQPNLALERWELVERDRLKNERDRALFDAREALVWAYNRNTSYTDAQARDTIESALEGVKGREIRIYLRMVQANVTVTEANRLDDDRDKEKIRSLLGEPLNKFVEEFDDAERAWAKANYRGPALSAEEMTLSDVRHRVWLRRVVREFETEATILETPPDWTENVKTIIAGP